MRRLTIAGCLLGLVLWDGLQIRPTVGRTDEPKATAPATVPFELIETKHMAVKIKLNGKGPYRVIFDTGAPVTVLNNRIARDSGVIPKNTPKPEGFLGMLAPAQIKIKSLELGDLKAAGVPAVIMDHPTVEAMNQVLGPVEGIVGFPFFARYRMTLDYQAKKMTFVPNGYQPGDVLQNLLTTLMTKGKDDERVLAPAGLWGLVVRQVEDDEQPGVTIKQVMPESAAAKAGLKAGDRILTLDGRWTDTVADCYAAAGFVKPGTTVTVVIQRDGKQQAISVAPAAGL